MQMHHSLESRLVNGLSSCLLSHPMSIIEETLTESAKRSKNVYPLG